MKDEKENNKCYKIIGLLFLVQMVVASSGFIITSWELSKSEIGLVTTIFFLMGSITGLPSGWLTDALGPKSLFLIGQSLIVTGLIGVVVSTRTIVCLHIYWDCRFGQWGYRPDYEQYYCGVDPLLSTGISNWNKSILANATKKIYIKGEGQI